MTLLQHQRQRLSSNCGPTCVAILARVSQNRACREVFGEVLSRNCGSEWREIHRGLRGLGLKFGRRACYVSKWQSIPEIAIVACSRRFDGDWHWVVYSPHEGLIYDPERARLVPITQSRRKPFSYLTVRPRV
jgi:hypothetical protein